MIHYGDVCKINGAEIPKVDCITFGAPCQDLSVAGKRQGMKHSSMGDDETTRSGLFFEAVRIIKEMREDDRRNNHRANWNVRPRYAVYENVPGAFSSNNGADFQAVLTEIVKIVQPDAPHVPLPDKWGKSGTLMGYGKDGCPFSVSWRVHDAQFWGVPQRRKRIALVADFGGLSAPDILFERKGLRGDFTQSGEERESTSPDLKGGVGATSWTLKIRGGVEIDSAGKKAGKGALVQTERAGTIGVSQDQTLITIPMEGNGARPSHHGDGYGKEGDPMFSLNTTEQHKVAMVYDNHPADARITECGDTAPTVAARYGTGGNNTPLVYEHRKQDARLKELGDVAPTVEAAYGAGGNNTPLVCDVVFKDDITIKYDEQGKAFTVGARDYKGPQCVSTYQEVTGSLCPGSHPGSYNGQDAYNAVYQSVVRRLTPLECERLQGYPGGWTDIGEWVDEKGKTRKTTDSARYKALGNSIALPFWFWLLRRISAQYERVATLGSLFSGLGGFELCWERCNGKGTALWASEIEPFCIAVTKVRFPECTE